MLAYALTIFLSAFLLFQVQPLIGKYILPWFGGGPGVWTTCLVFFQVVLLGGYAYAHLTSSRLKARGQAALHLSLLAGALCFAHITPSDAWKPRGDENPTAVILVLLTVCLGLPYFVLSSTGPLLQQWFSRAKPGVSPYRLYALSNLASLLALVSYPFFFETYFTRKAQAELWAWGFGAFAVCCGFCAVKLWQANPASAVGTGNGNDPGACNLQPATFNKLLWLLLPACATMLLLATTNKICQDVAVIPFLWVLPLTLYLLSFIVCFDNPRWYRRPPFALALIAAMVAMCWALFQGTDASLRAQVIIYSAGLFVYCMVCHGELYRLRPDPRQLTGYYLMISAGGALGGLFVALAAPMLFKDFYELHWGLVFCGLLFWIVCLREHTGEDTRSWRWLGSALTLAVFAGCDQWLVWLAREHAAFAGIWLTMSRFALWLMLGGIIVIALLRKRFLAFRHWRSLACGWIGCGLAALAVVLHKHARHADEETVYRSRNFYGTLAVCEYRKSHPLTHYYLLQHGRITHGLQFTDPERAQWPTTYYGEGSGVSLAVSVLPTGPRRLGVVGLGTGTMAVFGRPGDTVRLYEINPEVTRLATSRFTYLSNCEAKVEIALGDARLSLEREPSQQFDLLALDAFSSDAIPVHLLTEEAFELYNRHLKPAGIIAVHISNRYLNLEPVVLNLARRFHYQVAIIDFDEDDEDLDDDAIPGGAWWNYSSTWVLLTRDEAILKLPAIASAAAPARTNVITVPLWTDDFASVFQILK